MVNYFICYNKYGCENQQLSYISPTAPKLMFGQCVQSQLISLCICAVWSEALLDTLYEEGSSNSNHIWTWGGSENFFCMSYISKNKFCCDLICVKFEFSNALCRVHNLPYKLCPEKTCVWRHVILKTWTSNWQGILFAEWLWKHRLH